MKTEKKNNSDMTNAWITFKNILFLSFLAVQLLDINKHKDEHISIRYSQKFSTSKIVIT